MALFRLLLARRKWVIRSVALVTVLGIAYLLSQPNVYTSRAIILPSGKSSGNLSALKAMVGIGGAFGMSDENSSALFPVILGSHLVRDGVLARDYSFSADGRDTTLTLSEYFGRTDRDKLRRSLAGATTVRADGRTGEIVVAVETEFPELSREICQEYINQLEQFNLHQRKSGASENAEYLANQVSDAEVKLAAAEGQLETFRAANANWAETTSPSLLTQHRRLIRETEIRSTAYLLLQEQYELAKLEAQKDIPIVNLLDAPSLPTQKSGPFRTVKLLTAQVVTFVFVVVLIFGIDLSRQLWRGQTREDRQTLTDDIRSSFPRAMWLAGKFSPKREASPV